MGILSFAVRLLEVKSGCSNIYHPSRTTNDDKDDRRYNSTPAQAAWRNRETKKGSK